MNDIKLTANHFKIRQNENEKEKLEKEMEIIERAITSCFSKGISQVETGLAFLSENSKKTITETFESPERGFKVEFLHREKEAAYITTIVLSIK